MAAAMMTMPVMSLRPVGVQRAAAVRPSRVAVQTRRIIAVRASPADTEKSALETAIDNARETCEGGPTGECANAWDDVEELSAELGHKRERAKETKKDVLDEYCEDNPDADECRVYED